MADSSFSDRVADRDLVIGVVGLGYVGLPLAVSYAESGFRVIGYDIVAERVNMLDAGNSYVDDVPDGRLAGVTDSGRLRATDDAQSLSETAALFSGPWRRARRGRRRPGTGRCADVRRRQCSWGAEKSPL